MSKKTATMLLTLSISIIGTGVFVAYKKKYIALNRTISYRQEPTADSKKEKISDKYHFKDVTFQAAETKLTIVVPDGWLVETRRSADKQWTVDEKREFLATSYRGDVKSDLEITSDYSGFTWGGLEKKNQKEIEKLFIREANPFPVASIAKNDGQYQRIQYTDWNAEQIDFYVLNNEMVQEKIALIDKQEKLFLAANNNDPDLINVWSKEMVGGVIARLVTFPVAIEESGKIVPTKDRSGGQIYFINLEGSGKTLLIEKQARGDNDFENIFDHLLAALRFE